MFLAPNPRECYICYHDSAPQVIIVKHDGYDDDHDVGDEDCDYDDGDGDDGDDGRMTSR